MAGRFFNVRVDLRSVTIHSRMIETKTHSFLLSGIALMQSQFTKLVYAFFGMTVVNAIENIIAAKAIPFCQDSVSPKSNAYERTPTKGDVSADTAATEEGSLETSTDHKMKQITIGPST